VVALVGEAGVGKSRIAWEFGHSQSGWLVLESTALSYGRATAYLPVVELLGRYFRVESRDDTPRIEKAVTGRLQALGGDLHQYLPAFLGLLEVPIDDEGWHRLDPAQRRQRTQDGVTRLFLSESQNQPVLIVFEDLHWIDGATQAVLDRLVESVAGAPLLLLVTYRPEYRHGWSSKAHYRQIGLYALPPASAGELLNALLGTDSTLDQVKRLLIGWTEGNPFFLEETVRELVETGVLAGEHGARRLARPLGSPEIPPSATAILAARIDRLEPDDKRLLQAASVIGHDVPFPLLRAIADEDEDRLRQGLAQLQAAEFLDETRLFPELEYRFRHALTHEVAYESVLHDRRRRLHARIAAALEALAAAGPREQVERLAHHALAGELWEKALAYARLAGEKAFAASANREAVTCFTQALRALEHLPRTAAMLEQALDVRLDIRNALHPLGEFERIIAVLGEAEALADEVGDGRRGGRVAAFKTQYFWWSGDYAAALASGERALRLADENADLAVRILASYFLGNVHHALGEYARAMELLRHCVALLTGERRHERFGVPGHPAVLCRFYLSLCLAELGEFAEGLAKAEEARSIAEEVENPFSLTQAHFALGFLSLRRGDLAAAIPPLERALDVCQRWQIPIWFPRVASCLGSAYAMAGRLEEGLHLLEQATAAAEARGLLVRHVLSIVWLGEAYLRAGRADEALTQARRAHALAEQHREHGHAAWALRLLADIAARHPGTGLDPAGELYVRARELGASLGMRPLVAHCLLGLGSLHRQGGDRARFAEHLAAAAALYREMDMPLGLAETRAEQGRLG
jgi:tetratricopeptide (TPR) repeat protein